MFVSIELYNEVICEILVYIPVFAVFFEKKGPVTQARGAACHILVFLRM